MNNQNQFCDVYQGETEEPLYVLCVDDEENILKALKRLFHAEPFRVLTAGSGPEALEILKHNGNIGLILSDQRMPGMSGSAFLRAASALKPDIPRLILTGYADFQSATDAINQGGACRYLSKPYNDQELLQAVHDGLQRYQLVKMRNQAEQKLRQARDEAERANRLKSEFLANMSHELRSPLNTILGYGEILRDEIRGPLTEEQKKIVDVIEQSGRHLLSLINEILDLAKIEADMMTVNNEMVSVEALCAGSLLFVREQALCKQLRLTVTTQSVPAYIRTDPLRMKQILINLLSNAVKFTPEGGEVELMVEGFSHGEKLRFTVRDTGIGISAEDQARLFKPFTQVNGSQSRQNEGTGLGLALVARLAALLEGEVALESEPGKGSRFIVTLPRLEFAERRVTA